MEGESFGDHALSRVWWPL